MEPEKAYFQAGKQGYGTPEQEAVIATDAAYSYYYANDVIKGKWEPGEAMIATDTRYSYYCLLYTSPSPRDS